LPLSGRKILPFSHWRDQIVDDLIAFHLAHPAFDTLFDAPPSLAAAGLAQQLPKELQARFELGFQVRTPTSLPYNVGSAPP